MTEQTRTQTSVTPTPSFAERSLKIEEYFAGKTFAWGIFQDRFGMPRRSFEASMEGAWEGDVFVLAEDFRFHDGEVVDRTWRFKPVGDNAYQGSANDVKGTASARREGGVLLLRYSLLVPVKGKIWTMDFDDRMYLLPGGYVINRARASKFGVTLGNVTASFSKDSAEAAMRQAAE